MSLPFEFVVHVAGEEHGTFLSRVCKLGERYVLASCRFTDVASPLPRRGYAIHISRPPSHTLENGDDRDHRSFETLHEPVPVATQIL